MAATATTTTTISLFHSSSLKWHRESPPLPIPPPRHCRLTRLFRHLPLPRTSGGPAIRCFAPKHPSSPTIFSSPVPPMIEQVPRRNPLETVLSAILRALESLKKPAVAAVMLALLLAYNPSSTLAASGGRMGGSSFSSRSSSSYSSSSSSSSRSYTMRAPSPGFSYSAPYYGPWPFGGVYVGPAVGVGVGAGSSLFFILMGFAAFLLVSGFLSDRSEGGVLTETEKTTVLKLQVGLLGMGRAIQKDLNRIADFADTSSPAGLSYVLTETTLALLRNPDYCISGYSAVDVKRSMEDGEKRFNQLSIEERGKFDEETLVNVNSIRKQSTTHQRSSGFSNEYIVITILVAAEGVHKLPAINGSRDLKEALQMLGSIPSSKILAVEVLWTPQNENDTLTERELLEDYPLLRPL